MKFEYFGGHGRGLPIRLMFDHTKTDYEDVQIDFPTFGASKAAGKYKFGQVPMLTTDDGKQMFQTCAILRYLGKTLGDGSMYPAFDDALTTYRIDEILAELDDFINVYNKFFLPIVPAYKNKDEHFTKFITSEFDAYLAKLEERLTKSSGKYLFGDKLTIADFSTLNFFFKLSHNELYEHNLILKVILGKYPKSNAYVEDCFSLFKEYLSKNQRPF